MADDHGQTDELYPFGAGSHAPLENAREMPDCYPIKGNVRDDGTQLYHRPDSRNYGATVPEVWFDSPSAAEAAGFELSPTHPRGSTGDEYEPGRSGHPCTVNQVMDNRNAVPGGAASGAGVLTGVPAVDGELHPYGVGSRSPLDDAREMPDCYPIKGNVRDDGTQLYHRPDSRNYGATVPEVWFDSPSAAEAAGFELSPTHPRGSTGDEYEPGRSGHPCTVDDVNRTRAAVGGFSIEPLTGAAAAAAGGGGAVAVLGADAVDTERHPYGVGSHSLLDDEGEMPACYPIKGNIRNDGSRLYHRPDSRNYGATGAEVWFDAPSAAEAAGFVLAPTHPRRASAADFEPGGSGHPCTVDQVDQNRSASAGLAVAGLGLVGGAAAAGAGGSGGDGGSDSGADSADADGGSGGGRLAAAGAAGAAAAAAGAAALRGRGGDDDDAASGESDADAGAASSGADDVAGPSGDPLAASATRGSAGSDDDDRDSDGDSDTDGDADADADGGLGLGGAAAGAAAVGAAGAAAAKLSGGAGEAAADAADGAADLAGDAGDAASAGVSRFAGGDGDDADDDADADDDDEGGLGLGGLAAGAAAAGAAGLAAAAAGGDKIGDAVSGAAGKLGDVVSGGADEAGDAAAGVSGKAGAAASGAADKAGAAASGAAGKAGAAASGVSGKAGAAAAGTAGAAGAAASGAAGKVSGTASGLRGRAGRGDDDDDGGGLLGGGGGFGLSRWLWMALAALALILLLGWLLSRCGDDDETNVAGDDGTEEVDPASPDADADGDDADDAADAGDDEDADATTTTTEAEPETTTTEADTSGDLRDAALAALAAAGLSGIDVEVDGDVVRLAGEVASDADVAAAQAAIDGLDGVGSLSNDITVAADPGADLQAAAEAALAAAGIEGVDVEVDGDVVRLVGEVDSDDAVAAAEAALADVEGIGSVANDLTVVAETPAADATDADPDFTG